MTAARSNDWIQTMRGRGVDLLDPRPEDIDPTELAILAGRLGRFGNHTLSPYSVADHSVRVANLCPAPLKLAGLLHDAHEAYWGIDFPRPWKRLFALHTNIIAAVEAAWDEAIGKRFGIDPQLFHAPAVKQADDVMLATEKRDLMAPCDREWMALPAPLGEPITPFREPAVRFADLLGKLTGEKVDLESVRRGTVEKPRGLAAVADMQHLTCYGAPPLGPVAT